MTDELPPLPELSYLGDDVSYGYDAEDMRAYALQAVAAERERWIGKAGSAYAEAHAIFNDPPSETPQVVRDVIEWHLYTMREDIRATSPKETP